MKELIFLEPVVKKCIWGSEYWTVSAHENGDCLVKGGTFDGMHLSEVWRDHKELFGEGQVWYNMKRLNKDIISNVETRTIPASNDIYVIPIPEEEYAYRQK